MSKKGLRYRPIIIGGVPRSGTTLLRVMLTSHPNLCGGPEFKLLPFVSQLYQLATSLGDINSYYKITQNKLDQMFGELATEFFEDYRHAHQGKRLVEKTPQNLLEMPFLAKMLPKAQFIHVIRDGRDVATSLEKMDWLELPSRKPVWYVQNKESAFHFWNQTVLQALEQANSPELIDRIHIVKYEDLVLNPETTLRELLSFLEEPWSNAVLSFTNRDPSGEPMESSTLQVRQALYKSSIGRWAKETSSEDVAMFKTVGSGTLVQLGYESGSDWGSETK